MQTVLDPKSKRECKIVTLGEIRNSWKVIRHSVINGVQTDFWFTGKEMVAVQF